MSLVVLGIFSFRDLGVDLFPRADPATVNVRLSLPGASPDERFATVSPGLASCQARVRVQHI